MISTVADFKLWAEARELDLTASNDTAIGVVLQNATDFLEGFCHRTFDPIEGAVEYVMSGGGFYLAMPDFAAVTQVELGDVVVDSARYRVMPSNKYPKNLLQAVRPYEFTRGEEYKVTGTRGFAPNLPSNVHEAVFLCACVSLFAGGGMLMKSVSVQGMTVNLADEAERDLTLRTLLGSIVRV